jgi:hypothetical protein
MYFHLSLHDEYFPGLELGLWSQNSGFACLLNYEPLPSFGTYLLQSGNDHTTHKAIRMLRAWHM